LSSLRTSWKYWPFRGILDPFLIFHLRRLAEKKHKTRRMQRAASLLPSTTVRLYSAQAGKMVKPPIPLFGVEGSYTSAVYSAAAKNNKLDAVEKDLKALQAVVEKDPKFREFLANPLISVSQKKDILKQVVTSKLAASDLTVNLLHAMTENGRLKLLPQVVKQFVKIMQVSRGEVEATVYTAKPIDDATQKEIENSLKGFTNKKLAIKMAVDPTIIGGIVVDFGGEHYIDMSIRSKLKIYTDLLQQAV